MVTGAGRTAVSHLFAAKFLRLATQAESNHEFRQARSYFLTAIQHDPTPRSAIEFGRFLADNQLLEDAVTVLQDAWQLAKRRACGPSQATCCRQLAMVYRELGNQPLARRFLQRAAEAEMRTWRVQDAVLSCDQLLCESTFAADDGELRRATALCEAALTVAENSERGTALRQSAVLALRSGDARRATRHALAAVRDTRDVYQVAECLEDLGHILRGTGRGSATVCFRMAKHHYRCAGNNAAARAMVRWIRESDAIARLMKADPARN
jgi:tetratricopeptide (TPR) repeat protein